MIWILMLFIIVSVILVRIKLKKRSGIDEPKLKKQTGIDEPISVLYEKIDTVFTPAERSFYGALKQAIGNEAEIFAKIRVADVLKPKSGGGKSEWQILFNKISGKHFDFIVCKNDDLSVVCAIELNDKSHKNEERQERDNFLVSACGAAQLPLVSINAQAGYKVSEIKATLAQFLPILSASNEELKTKSTEKQNTVVATPESLKHEVYKADNKICPKCSSLMVTRVAKNGAYAGKKFWACSAYPKCKQIEAIDA